MEQEWNEKQVFLGALGLRGRAREEYLEGACPSPEHRARIERLLRLHEEAPSGFLESLDAALGAATSQPAPEQIDGFKIVRELGRGGMGVVYLARDVELDRLVALKVLAPHLVGSERAIARFRQEARAVAALSHAAIVPVHRFAESAGQQYIAMEYVEGRTLAAVLDEWRGARGASPGGTASAAPTKERRMSMARALAEIADALDHAHRRGVIHRDVKPSNIIMDAAGRAHLTDFGIAKLMADETPTVTGERAGTVHYMSPEQAALVTATVDHRADIFSLGVVLYEAITLVRPFDGETTHQVLEAIRGREPRSPRSIDATIERDLETICLRALEKRPSERYQTAAHLGADLRCYLVGDPILARPPGLLRRARVWARRRRRAVGAAIGVGLVVGCVGLAWRLASVRAGSLCALSVRSDVAGSRVRLLPTVGDGAGGRIGRAEGARELGIAAVTTRVPVGHYRVVAISPDGGFAESSVMMVSPGEEVVVELRPRLEVGGEDMVLIEAGTYVLGAAGAARSVRIEAFSVDRAEVSNREYLGFVEKTRHERPAQWTKFQYDEGIADLPVVGVSWEDAQAFARWKGKRLPSADEWECAMRGRAGGPTPWGAAAAPVHPIATIRDRDNLDYGGWAGGYHEYATHAMPVRSHPELATMNGLFHGATNVRELTDTILPGPSMQVVVKGASWVDDPERLDFSARLTNPIRSGEVPPIPTRSLKTGFRCVRSVQPFGGPP